MGIGQDIDEGRGSGKKGGTMVTRDLESVITKKSLKVYRKILLFLNVRERRSHSLTCKRAVLGKACVID